MKSIFAFALVLALTAACSKKEEPVPTPLPTPVPTVIVVQPTDVPPPPPTEMPQPTAKPEPTMKPEPTVKPEPTEVPKPQPTKVPAPVPTKVPAEKLTFTSSEAFSLVTFKEGVRFDSENPPFKADAFYADPKQICVRVKNGDVVPGEEDIHHMSPWQYATLETTEYLKRALGATGINKIELRGFPCTSVEPQYELIFKDEDDDEVRLNAGLVANSFNKNPEWQALLMTRTEIASGFHLPVPTWDETAKKLNAGEAVLGIRFQK